MSGFWSGTFTDYGTAVGTLGLAAITTWVGIREAAERRQLRQERDAARRENELNRRRAAEQEAERREIVAARAAREAQASRIGLKAELIGRGSAAFVPNSDLDGRESIILAAIVTNNSQEPIEDLAVHWTAWDTRSEIEFQYVGHLPGGGRSIATPVPRAVQEYTGGQPSKQPVTITFLDRDLVRWSRGTSALDLREIAD